jgi:dolichol-phosphate mannosyltransferase
MIDTSTIISYCHTKLFRFSIVGATGTIWNLGIMYIMTDIVGIHYVLSYVIAFSIALVNNYLLNSYWTFKQEARAAGLFKYGAVSLFTLFINGILLYLLTDKLGIWYMFSSAIGILSAFIINYFISRRIVWK